MGIKGIKPVVSSVAIKRRIDYFKNKRVALDASIYFYQYLYRAPNDEECDKYVADGFLEQLKIFKRHKITPVYVFDGKALDNKKVLEDRQDRRDKLNSKMDLFTQEIIEGEIELSKLEENMDELVFTFDEDKIITESSLDIIDVDGNVVGVVDSDVIDVDVDGNIDGVDGNIDNTCEIVEDIRLSPKSQHMSLLMQKRELHTKLDERRESIQKLSKQARKPKSVNIENVKKLLKVLNVPYLQSPIESDALFYYLISTGKVDAIFTEDTDMLPLRCKSFVCGFGKKPILED